MTSRLFTLLIVLFPSFVYAQALDPKAVEFFEQKKSSSAFQEYSVNKIYHLFVFAVDVDKLHG